MKTEYQIRKQISLSVLDAENWDKIHDFCLENLKMRVPKPRKGTYPYTFEQFVDWYNNGVGLGDVIYFNNSLAIVSYSILGHTDICAYIDDNGKLHVPICPYHYQSDDIRLATHEEKLRMLKLMCYSGYSLNVSSGILMEKIPIRKGNMYSFIFSDNIWCGHVLSRSGDEITMGYGLCDGILKDSPIQIPVSSIISMLEPSEEERCSDLIAYKYELEWSVPASRLIAKLLPTHEGSKYYYLTDKFTIASAVENGKKLSMMRRVRGNYFYSLEEAECFLVEMQKLRTDMKKRDYHH